MLTIKKSLTKGIAIAIGLAACYGQAVTAKELRIAPGVPPAHPATDPLYTTLQEKLPEATDGRLTAKLLGPEIASLSEMRTGIKSGLVDAGLFLSAYFPADLPEFNLVGDMAFLGANPQAMGAALTEYIVTCADCQAELKKLGVVFTSAHSTNIYQILSNKPVTELEDLKGLRLRAGGPQYSRWAEAMGAAPASIPVGEQFEALSQGVIDGTLASTADIVSFRLDDAIKYVTEVPLGTFFSDISHAVSLNTWKSLSTEDRKALIEVSSLASTLCTDRWATISDKGMGMAAKAGVEVLQPSQGLIDATQAFVEEDLKTAASQAGERYGIENADAKLARFQELVTKWEGIADSANNDPAAVADAMNSEIWSKVDFSTYGI
ncbi:C4-dicarboxylate TRAP transporter substrate-binding protein [Marinobacterium mangrovicola]|uniref:TRAP-type C4-dicarboxylate transport system substrate-binding protein n=1 Tax=Marinobacterium mangrovicola TaxID=1476959 RepID=A0A4R1GG73_9GAMM|nr:C4-dicarboxylate TRAP transporter substrate-binding protein [Marinobacterium mangrovicola]TCK07274.1 TRAP-type C4-dicarboxylate transport system substrate-binding protein [Marinobacterium mangrovicola]